MIRGQRYAGFIQETDACLRAVGHIRHGKGNVMKHPVSDHGRMLAQPQQAVTDKGGLVAGCVDVGVRDHAGIELGDKQGDVPPEHMGDLFQDPRLLLCQGTLCGREIALLIACTLLILQREKMHRDIIGTDTGFFHFLQNRQVFIRGDT